MNTAGANLSPDASTGMILVREVMHAVDPQLPEIALRVDRQKLARRRWRGRADDGTDIGVELSTPARHGDVVWSSSSARYVIRQAAEPLLEVSVDVPPEEAAVIGWAVGNMHFVIEAQARCIRAPDDPALRQALGRVGIPYRETHGVFQPHRFASIVGHSHEPGVEGHPFIRAHIDGR